MEKIQSAIAKARLSRQQGEGARVQAPRPAQRLDEDRTRDAWAEIETFDPNPKHLRERRIVSGSKGSEGTEFDKLRTRMLQHMQARKWTRVAITSPGPGCGKSTIALNLGLSLAKQPSLKTLICEIDLKRPALSSLLGVEKSYDLSRVLAGVDPFSDHAVRLRPNLAAGLVHASVDASAEMLQGPQLGAILDEIEARYTPDIMIFDMPPLQVSDDAMGFADKVDCALIIAGAGSTTVADIDSSERDLSERTEVLGVILNKCRDGASESKYGYYE